MEEVEVPPGWVPLVVPAGTAQDKAALLDGFAEAGRFPDWVGRNWDALQDALADLAWLDPAEGYLVILDGWEEFTRRSPADAEVVLDVLRQVAEERGALGGTPLVAVIRG